MGLEPGDSFLIPLRKAHLSTLGLLCRVLGMNRAEPIMKIGRASMIM